MPSLELDPFGRWPLRRSGVEGLGGSTPAPAAGYAFSSRYAYAEPGPARITLAFEGLQASAGRLKLTLRAHANGEPRHRKLQRLSLDLPALAQGGGGRVLSFTARAGVAYGLEGVLEGAADARARGLSLTLDPASDGREFRRRLELGRRRVFGPHAPSRALLHAGLAATGTATLARPVSQMCTAAQFSEPEYARAAAEIGEPPRRHRKQWEFVFILRALEEAGVLRPGARGLGFAVGGEPLPAAFAARGCRVLATDLPPGHAAAADWRDSGQLSDAVEGLLRPALHPEAAFRAQVAFRPVDMTAIPADLGGFDFCWSACAFEHLGSIRAGLRFVERAMRVLRPGGTAVHTTELNLTSNAGTVDHSGTVLFRRRDLERLALRLHRCGCTVAPFNYDQGGSEVDAHVDLPPYGRDEALKVALRRYVSASFGLVVTRGPPRA